VGEKSAREDCHPLNALRFDSSLIQCGQSEKGSRARHPGLCHNYERQLLVQGPPERVNMSIFGNDRYSDTDEAICAPCVGDRYTEMYSFELFVVYVDAGTIATLECSRCEGAIMPKDGVLRVQTQEEFQKRLSYSSGGGYWMNLVKRNFNVAGWYEFAIAKEAVDASL